MVDVALYALIPYIVCCSVTRPEGQVDILQDRVGVGVGCAIILLLLKELHELLKSVLRQVAFSQGAPEPSRLEIIILVILIINLAIFTLRFLLVK